MIRSTDRGIKTGEQIGKVKFCTYFKAMEHHIIKMLLGRSGMHMVRRAYEEMKTRNHVKRGVLFPIFR